MFRNTLRPVSRNLFTQKPITTPYPSFLFNVKQTTNHNLFQYESKFQSPVSRFRRSFHSTRVLGDKNTEKQQEEGEQKKEEETFQPPPNPNEEPPSKLMSYLKWAMLIIGSGSIIAVAVALSREPFNDYFELRLDDELYYEDDRAKGTFKYFLDRVWFLASNPHILTKYRLLPPAPFPSYTIVLDTTDIIHFDFDITKVGHRGWLRPHVADFIDSVSQDAELILWSTHVDPGVQQKVLKTFSTIFSGCLGRLEAYNLGTHVFKDLRRLNRPLSHVILISSDPEYGVLQPENTILIPPYEGELDDESFQQLQELLKGLFTNYPAGRFDIRQILKYYDYRDPLEAHIESSRKTKRYRMSELTESPYPYHGEHPDPDHELDYTERLLFH